MAETFLEVPQYVCQWINKTYPKPKIDPAWVQQCYDWIVNSKGVAPDPPNYPKIIAEIKDQILKSDLFDATVDGTGLPPQVASSETTMRISGPPVLVQIKALTDVGISAFKLEEVRKAREERMRSGPVIDDDDEAEGDIEVEGEGPMPKYPRGTLMFELSDGKTTLKAMEYKPLPELSLLTTPLGYKMQLKDVRVVLGVAHLEPRNVILHGGNSADNELRDHYFKQGLRGRLGLPLEPVPDGDEQRQTDRQPEEVVRAQDRSPPPEINHDSPIAPQREDGDSEPRRRVPATTGALPAAGSRSTANATINGVSPYFANGYPPPAKVSMNLQPTLRQAAPTLHASSRSSPDFDDNFDADFDMDDWAALDEIEKAATSQVPAPGPSRSGPVDASSSRSATKGPVKRVEPYTGLSLADDLTLIKAKPKQSKFPHILGKAPTLGQPIQLAAGFGASSAIAGDSDEYDMELQLGSEELRYLDEVEQRAASSGKRTQVRRSSSSRTTASPSKPWPSNAAKSTARPQPKAQQPRAQLSPSKPSGPPPSSQAPPQDIIYISDSEGDSSVCMIDQIDMTQDPDTDDKENEPEPPRNVRKHVGNNVGPVASSAQRQISREPLPSSQRRQGSRGPPTATQRMRRRPITLPDDPEIIDIPSD